MTTADFDLYFAIRYAFLDRRHARIWMRDDPVAPRRVVHIEDIIDAPPPSLGLHPLTPWVALGGGWHHPRPHKTTVFADQFIMARGRLADFAILARGARQAHAKDTGVPWRP